MEETSVHGDEGKQNKRRRGRTSWKTKVEDKFDNFGENSRKELKQATKTNVQVVEDNKIVTMEVEGMEEEFTEQSSMEDTMELSESEEHSESESEEERVNEDNVKTGTNNNATKVKKSRRQLNIEDDRMDVCDSKADTVMDPSNLIDLNLGEVDEEKIGEDEAILFDKWEKYMKQKGLVHNVPVDRRIQIQNFNQRSATSGSKQESSTNGSGKVQPNKKEAIAKGKIGEAVQTVTSPSESTIYKSAVMKADANFQSSSDDDSLINELKESDSSDDNIEKMLNEFVGSQRLALDDCERQERLQQLNKPGTSQPKENRPNEEGKRIDHGGMMRRVEDESEAREREAVKGKMKVFGVSGKQNTTNICTSVIDEDFMILGAHIDEQMAAKIGSGEYVNFAKLIPKEKMCHEDDNRLEMINKGGLTYWVPVSDREVTVIDSVERWDQAYRVYAKLYSKMNPNRSQELVEYSFIIHSAAKVYSWRNVYTYDKLFCTHMGKHHERNWGIILQQVWSFCLTEKINHNHSHKHKRSDDEGNSNKKRKKVCFDFNAGYCSYGFGCKFEHRCGICGKFGHGAHNCRRMSGGNKDRYRFNKSNDRWQDRVKRDGDKSNNGKSIKHHGK